VTIENITITHFSTGIKLESSHWNTFNSIVVNENQKGIHLYESGYNDFNENTVLNNTYGIYNYKSNNNRFYYNTIAENRYGSYSFQSDNTKFFYNEFLNNNYGIYNLFSDSCYSYRNTISNSSYGIRLFYSDYNRIYYNEITNNYFGIYLSYSNSTYIVGNSFSDNDHGIYDPYSNDNIITDNKISNNRIGIKIGDSQNNTVADNEILENEIGIHIENSDSNTFTNNMLSENDVGIDIDDSNDNSLANNMISENDYGLQLNENSSNNNIHHNNLIENDVQATDDGTNIWDDGEGTGNYWSNYSGADNDNDGIGDTSHLYDDNPIIEPPQNTPPVADAGGPYTGFEGSAVTLGALGSFDYNDGDSLQYRWDFDDDGNWDTEYSIGPTAVHTWYDDYEGTIVVEVTDGELTDTANTMVTINNTTPVADAGIDQLIDINEKVSFSGSYIDLGNLDTHIFKCDFGDETTTFGSLTSNHTYSEFGIYIVTLTVIDDDGGIGTDTLVITVGSPQALKEDVILKLENAKTGSKKVDKKIDKAIEHIQKSLNIDPKHPEETWKKHNLWIDDKHLDPKQGHKVFNEEKKAVKELMHLMDKKDTPQSVIDACQAAIDVLIEADFILAELAYKEVEAIGGDEPWENELEKCEKEFEKAQKELDHQKKDGTPDPDYDKAIDHFKKAWEHAQKALKHAG